jgi:hypothetical protein
MFRSVAMGFAVTVALCGNAALARSAPPEIDFSEGFPAHGATYGQVSIAVDFKNAPNAKMIEVQFYTSRKCLGLQIPILLQSTSTQVSLPKGSWVGTLSDFPRGAPITLVIADLKDNDENVIASKQVGGLLLIVR